MKNILKTIKISSKILKILIKLKSLISKQKIKKLLIINIINTLIIYYLYKKKQSKILKYFKKTNLNKKIIKNLKPFLKTYNPTFYLPTPLTMIIAGNMNPFLKLKNSKIKFQKEKIKFEDGGFMNLEWYPENCYKMEKGTPIVAFILGYACTSEKSYSRIFANIVKNQNWIFVILNRRGFDRNFLESPTFVDRDEIRDFFIALKIIKEKFILSNIYLCGVSAGANHGAKLLGIYKDEVPVKSFVSISNP